MRLINADALYERICDLEAQALSYVGKIGNDEAMKEKWRIWSAILAERTAFKHDVFDAPTIEERKTGKWIERNPQNSDKCRLIECSECGDAYIVDFGIDYEDWIEGRNFCRRCGADLRGEADDR